MDKQEIQIVDIGAGETCFDVATDLFKERIAVIPAQIVYGIVSFSPSMSDGSTIHHGACHVRRPVPAVCAHTNHPNPRRSL